jgi:hypothetical protein
MIRALSRAVTVHSAERARSCALVLVHWLRIAASNLEEAVHQAVTALSDERLESKTVVADLTKALPDFDAQSKDPRCLALSWSADGSTLFAGYTDNRVRVFESRV